MQELDRFWEPEKNVSLKSNFSLFTVGLEKFMAHESWVFENPHGREENFIEFGTSNSSSNLLIKIYFQKKVASLIGPASLSIILAMIIDDSSDDR